MHKNFLVVLKTKKREQKVKKEIKAKRKERKKNIQMERIQMIINMTKLIMIIMILNNNFSKTIYKNYKLNNN